MRDLLIGLGLIGLGFLALTPLAHADIITSGPDHYHLKKSAHSDMPADAMWKRLITPSQWWHHSFSGNSDNFTLDAKAGGMWLETWDGGSVEHGRVIYVKEGEHLRLNAPFGPLQDMAVTVIWNITLTPHADGGTMVTFEERATGSSASALDKMALAIDRVKTEGLMRLVNPASVRPGKTE